MPFLGGERTKLQMAHIKLAHSRAFLVRAYLLQTHEMLFDAHWHGFRVFGGVPGRGIYDNMRTAVDRVGRGKERQINIRFLAMANHYVFEPEFCNPAAGWEKGQVEKNVRDSRHQILQAMPDFPDLGKCPELCVSGPVHAVSDTQASKRSPNIMANWLRAANHSRTFRPSFSKLRMAR